MTAHGVHGANVNPARFPPAPFAIRQFNWPQDKNLTLWVGMGEFVRKLVWGLIFEIWDRSHGGDLVEDTISTFLITPIDPETDPKMAGMLVQDDTGWFGGGLGGDLGN